MENTAVCEYSPENVAHQIMKTCDCSYKNISELIDLESAARKDNPEHVNTYRRILANKLRQFGEKGALPYELIGIIHESNSVEIMASLRDQLYNVVYATYLEQKND